MTTPTDARQTSYHTLMRDLLRRAAKRIAAQRRDGAAADPPNALAGMEVSMGDADDRRKSAAGDEPAAAVETTPAAKRSSSHASA
jgi:hypothetical protein